ncbi:hypothetical protein ACFLZL_00485 [Thermodesulfobacteriota bacterium]
MSRKCHISEKTHIDPQKAAELIEAYYQQGWTDGFPVVPPSEHSITAMLSAAGLQEDTIIATIATRNAVITADKVALNAIMAGCLPEYMPVIVSAVKGMCHPDFSYHGMATSTGGPSLSIIVNGPIAKQLGINAKENVFGPGTRANMTIGRSLRLLMMNSLNTRPGILDCSTIGSLGKISFCFAENEADSPWEPLHVERGFGRHESTTTVYAAEDIMQVYNQLARTPEPFLLGMADAMANMGSVNITGQQNVIAVFAGEHAKVLKDNGWSKQQVKEYLFDHAKRTVANLKRALRLSGNLQPEDETAWRHVVRNPEDIIVVCAGGAVGNFSACLLGWGSYKSTRAITTII